MVRFFPFLFSPALEFLQECGRMVKPFASFHGSPVFICNLSPKVPGGQDIFHQVFEESSNHKQLQLSGNEIAYIERYNKTKKIGYRFSYDKFNDKQLIERITASRIEYDSLQNWTIIDYTRRVFYELREETTQGDTLKMTLNMVPEDFVTVLKEYEQLTTEQLHTYIEEQSKRGNGGLNAYKLELYKRYSNPFAAFILTLIGVSIASRKVRGGTGSHLFFGLLLSVTYIIANLSSVSFTVKGGVHPMMAVWIPNLVYLAIGIVLYLRAPKSKKGHKKTVPPFMIQTQKKYRI
jgi:lipopolysaccharide export system permease protein